MIDLIDRSELLKELMKMNREYNMDRLQNATPHHLGNIVMVIENMPGVNGTVIESGEYPYKQGFDEGKIVGYNKAIDDFMEKAESLLCENLIYQQMEDIAEQLKVGVKNEID